MERADPADRPVAHPVEPLLVDDFALEPAEDPVIGPELRRGPHPARAERRPARRAHPHPSARHRVHRGRRLRALRRRLLRPRSPAHARPRPRPRRRAAARRRTTSGTPTPRSTPAGSSRPSWPPAARVDPRHPRRTELVGPGGRRDGARAGLVGRAAGHGQPGRAARPGAGPRTGRRAWPTAATKAGAGGARWCSNAAGGGAQVVVRDGDGKVVFDGKLAFGQTKHDPGIAAGAGAVHGRLPGDHRAAAGAGRARQDRAAGAEHVTRPLSRFRRDRRHRPAADSAARRASRHTRQTMTTVCS